MNLPDNVIVVDFRKEFLDLVSHGIRELGNSPEAAIQWLIKEGEHPTFARCIVRKALRVNKWGR